MISITSDTTPSAPSNMISSTDSFTYNSRGEVISSTNDKASTKNRSYDYDPIGNRLAAIEGLTTSPLSSKNYLSNSLNQYIQISTTTPPSPSLSVPTYDLDGNTLSDGTGKLYTWDCENRLTQVTLPTGEVVKYFYDSQHRRIKREHISSNSTETTTYLYDEWNVISEFTTKTNGENSTKTYTWGLDLSNTLQGSGGVGGLLSQKITSNTISLFFFPTYDANGNVSELLNSTGDILAHYEYDAFGKEMSATGIYSSQTSYRFSTKPWDKITELNYYGYRYYSPVQGRWINRDIAGEFSGINIYAMCENDLLWKFDFLGLEGGDGDVNGFANSFKCERLMFRQDFDLPKSLSKFLDRIGIYGLKGKFGLEYKNCSGCCKSGKSGILHSISVKGAVEAEFGTPSVSLGGIKFRFGWYGRIGGQGQTQSGYNSCASGSFGGGCITFYGEAGFIASVETISIGIPRNEGGGRGGLNISTTLCSKCSEGGCKATVTLCISLRQRYWAKFDFFRIRREAFYERSDNWCWEILNN